MGNSLQDQLLKAGLVSSQKSREVRTDKRKGARQQRHGGAVETDAVKADTQRALAEKAERDRALNRQRQDEARRRGLAAEIEQLIQAHRIPRDGGDLPYHFADGAVLKKILVTQPVQHRLAVGSAAIVRLGASFELIPSEIAEKIRQRDPRSVVLQNIPTKDPDEDDAYAEHPIPDDLMW